MDIASDHPRNTWDFFWQTLSLEDMDSNFFRSLWYFHAQPPLFNGYGFILYKLFGPAQLAAMQYVQIFLGAATSAMVYIILQNLIVRKTAAVLCALLISLNPSLFLYEAFILYSLPVAFLTTLAVCLLSIHNHSGRMRYLILFIVSLNILVLTRSLFHIVLLLPCIIMGAMQQGRTWRKFLLYACLISTISLGWYLKNYAEFGFFGASSWMGSNLWRNVSQNYDRSELEAFHQAGLIDDAVLHKRFFSPPKSYADFGFNESSGIKVLDSDDYNNINMIAISQMYLRSSKALIRHDPAHYAQNCLEAYGKFCSPSFETGFVARNASLIPWHTRAWRWLQGSMLFNNRKGWLTSFYSLLIPICVLHFIVHFLVASRLSPRRVASFVRGHGVETLIALLITYVTTVSSLFEYGENCRFKFSIESLILIYFCAILVPGLYRLTVGNWLRLGGRRRKSFRLNGEIPR
jgi:4-amino-4-deoxy-L-arabinose transferase-like glycosyltransferase